MPPNPTLDTALELAALGMHVLPIVPGTKQPPFKTGGAGSGHAGAATTGSEQIREWFTESDYWLSVVLWLSGHCAVDVDIRPGDNAAAEQLIGLEQLTGYTMARRWSDVTACQTTPQRGWHYIFQLPAGFDRQELRNRLTPNIELAQMILVMAPSKGRKTIRSIAQVGTAELFPELVDLARKPARAKPGKSGTAVKVGTISALHNFVKRLTPGNRNNGYYWAACRAAEMVEQGAVSEASAAYLVETAVSIGLPRAEAELTYRSAMSRLELSAPAGMPAPVAATGWEKAPRSIYSSTLSLPEKGLYLDLLTGRNWRTGVFVTTTAALAARYGCKRETVRRWLHNLRAGGWVSFDSTAGQRRPLLIRTTTPPLPLTSSDLHTPPEATPPNPATSTASHGVATSTRTPLTSHSHVEVALELAAGEREFLAAIQAEIAAGTLVDETPAARATR
jgi:hypothetical protein